MGKPFSEVHITLLMPKHHKDPADLTFQQGSALLTSMWRYKPIWIMVKERGKSAK